MKASRTQQPRGGDGQRSSRRSSGSRSTDRIPTTRASGGREAGRPESRSRAAGGSQAGDGRSAGAGRRRGGSSAALPARTKAPGFKLHSTPDQFVDLRDFRGRPVVLIFYPADWSPVCGDELALFNEILPEFERHNAQLLGISVDGAWCHLAYSKDRKLHFPLLADFEPKGEVARDYGVYRQGDGVSERALFVIDEDGVIRWSYVSPMGVNPGADGALRALEEIHPQITMQAPQQTPQAMEVQHA